MSGRVGSITTDIITDGLIFNADSANRASYPRTGTTITDTVGNINGTINGSSFETTNDGIFNFDGTDDYINYGNTGILNGGLKLTKSIWLKTTDKTLTQGLFSTFFGKTYAEMSLISGGLYCWIGNGVSTSNYNIVNAANLNILNDTWVHLTMVFDGSQSANDTRLKAYKNGSLLTWSTVRTIPTSLGTSTASTYIGARNGANVFSGNMASHQIYNRALSDSEILHNYNALKSRFGL